MAAANGDLSDPLATSTRADRLAHRESHAGRDEMAASLDSDDRGVGRKRAVAVRFVAEVTTGKINEWNRDCPSPYGARVRNGQAHHVQSVF
jgi:hypothetical protein